MEGRVSLPITKASCVPMTRVALLSLCKLLPLQKGYIAILPIKVIRSLRFQPLPLCRSKAGRVRTMVNHPMKEFLPDYKNL